jgi:acetolactate synthase-1/3 small subunit
MKINATSKTRPEIVEIANIFRAKIVDFGENSVILEITGNPGKVFVLENALKKFGVIQIARTGKIALSRESKIDSELLKNI